MLEEIKKLLDEVKAAKDAANERVNQTHNEFKALSEMSSKICDAFNGDCVQFSITNDKVNITPNGINIASNVITKESLSELETKLIERLKRQIIRYNEYWK